MNKIVLPYYTLNASVLQDRSTIVNVHIKLNILVRDEAELTRELYIFLSSLQNDYIVSISISVLLNANTDTNLLAKIYLLLVLNRSIKGQEIIPIFTDNVHLEDSLSIDIIKTYLNQQGINDIEFPIFNLAVKGIQSDEDCSLLLLQNQFDCVPKEFAEKNECRATLIIASIDAINNVIALPDLKKQLTIYESDNLANIAISKYYMEKEEFESERMLWKQRTLLYKDFLTLSKKVQEKEYYEVLDWYHKEHEILPLWYKQFGHIIKVIMGKRSFRSLFDDNVKKYKD
ncbi:MAG: hypothetical protein JWR61_2499 [Ferruginibacter sp.]|uniref:hypothetical protein n=1 Tax=Ferruginibacter sp. TaxID=1940288 RepID=UPI00265A9B04|nr:hypothetical protein [Ferruginibacter sp.]MDB5277544.1 hypothetical protein [Ferruginibacter sp.]